MSQVRLIALQRAAGSVSKQLPLRPLTYRARAWDCAARAQVLSDPERRLEFLRLAGMWLASRNRSRTILRVPTRCCTKPRPELSRFYARFIVHFGSALHFALSPPSYPVVTKLSALRADRMWLASVAAEQRNAPIGASCVFGRMIEARNRG